jgi:hypothetical protein
MLETKHAAIPDAAQCDEKTIESITPPAVVGQDAKQMVSSEPGDTLEQHDVSISTPSPALERWNEPRINKYRYLATLYSFIIMGMNDAAIGVSIPWL